ncbi:MAG: PEGA domain-containing protein [Prevotella sp.]|nr:PEGA domain-containing protein [Prevotella sp.]
MRKVLLLFFTIIISLSAKADGISVVSFKLLDKDLTANTYGTKRIDQNGETAALIKIVTPEQDFTFNGGSLGIVATENKKGEIWLYVPRQAQKLTITHQSFGVLREYHYPIPVQGGRTYEMLLDIGIGRYVTITTSQAQSDVTVDGELIGKSPIYNRYMTYGKHTVVAQKDLYEGTKTINVVPTDSTQGRVESVDMQDMSRYYGDVTITVDNNAEIYFNDRQVGKGSWTTLLREGNYIVETRKADSDPAMTSFVVTAQQDNRIIANSPTPHTGYLSIYTRPANTKITYNGGRELDMQVNPPLPIGTYQVEFSKKGYITQNHEYTIRHNQTTKDTITLERISYVKPIAFYFGGAFTYQSLSGVTGILGLVLWNHDIQAGYTFGLAESDAVYWGGDVNTATKYKMNTISVKYGYQIPLLRKFVLTPQIGYSYNTLSAQAATEGSTTYGDGASSQNLSIGAKLILVPVQHLYIFVAPEYSFALSKDNNFKSITDSSNFSGEGFGVHAGLLVSF